jgi:hypothetical protein
VRVYEHLCLYCIFGGKNLRGHDGNSPVDRSLLWGNLCARLLCAMKWMGQISPPCM